ncbi:phenylacetate--CoA ligase family protein [Paenactinomyces guangxiensis]|uniref:Phenylacetate-coenzyme A ligase n=1 Tax=Paenactinomyces guangxiensis TaxID=1490290 RepID=A0A7W1WP87_9BACL|nr:phenylacetate--CoA ligase [Paenactinomyces guangxiensis]MBA4493406.1 phenylacetate--CoA ligase [Paenactinomyces guangxiensis]MBH8590497.1 phenylacetate--CoA ligase [Paenactinomyces guangxiensis]
MEREELSRLQDKRLCQTVERVYHCVPFYQKKFKESGVDPSSFKGLEELGKLPFTKKSDLRDHYPFGLFAAEMEEVIRLHASSGTKGKPTVVGYTQRDLDHWSEVCARAIIAAGGKLGDLFHNAYGYGLFTGGLGMHYGAERLGLTTIPVSGGNRARQAMLIEDFRPRGIAGTPSFILSLGEAMMEAGKKPGSTSLEYGIFGAEPWSEEMRQALEEMWGIHAVDIYGLSEVIGPGVAIECWQAKEGLHIAEDHFLVEVINPDTGEAVPDGELGELVFTTLTKEAMPVIRYRTGDLASIHREPCRCGRTHTRMSRIKGRVDDMLIIRGVNVFPSEIEPIILSQPELAPHYQLMVEREGGLDRLTIEVEVTETYYRSVGKELQNGQQAKLLQNYLLQKLRDTLGLSAQVVMHAPGRIPRSEGKAVRLIDRRNTDTHFHRKNKPERGM